MAEDKDVIYPGKDNPLLDPTAILSLERKMGTRGNAALESSFERNSEGLLVRWDELAESEKKIRERKSSLTSPAPTSPVSSPEPRQTERIPPQRDLSGGGAKSGIKPYKKSVSAFGRSDSPLARAAVGGMKNMIPTMGLSVAGISLGPFRFAPITYQGAFPVLNLRQWDKAMTASYVNLEDEQGNA
jgi:hypothetical protein